MKILVRVSAVVALLLTSGTTSVLAQSITTSKDGTGTQVTSASGNPNQFNIKGGTRAGANLFHSFEKFGLSQGQIANFMSNPSTRNILGRVVGGDASRINGLIKVTGGNSNLFLINPAGFIFGPNASLNLPGSFTATTANGIQIGDYWFDAMGQNNYANLVGEPNGFAFVSDTPGSIMNAGTLSVPQGEQITLVGGMVINTGNLEAPGGKVTIASVPHKQLVKISQEGNLLSLGLPSTAESMLSPGVEGFTLLALPELLTGGDEPIATRVIADGDRVRLTGSDAVLPTDPGTTLVAGTVDVSGPEGGKVHVLGEKVGLLGATIDASGENRGGTVLLGGDYKGQGEVSNASRTFIDKDSLIRADALKKGTGGKVIAWADDITAFYGEISARGGQDSGDGGFVEVSGKENLIFRGDVDLTAPNGNDGTLLLDPAVIEIVEAGTGANDTEVDDSEILLNDGGANETFTISTDKIVGNVILEATERVTFRADVGSEVPSFNLDEDMGTFSPFSIFSRTPKKPKKKLQSLQVLVEKGIIEVFGNINTEALVLSNNDGDIIIGKPSKPVDVFVATISSSIDSGISDPKSIGGSVDISAKNGNVRLFGGITLDTKSSFKLDALAFRATKPIRRSNVRSGSGLPREVTSGTYNVGIIYYGGEDDIPSTIESSPTIQLSAQFLNPQSDNKNKQTVLISGSSNQFATFNQDRRPNIEIIIREDISLPIGSQNIKPIGSGIEAPINSFAIFNTGDGSKIAQNSPFSSDQFRVGLLPDDPPNSNPLDDPPNLPDNTQKTLQNTLDDESTTEGSVYLPTNCSVTNTGQVQCSQAGKVLALTFDPPTDAEGNVQFPISPEQFPELLTGDDDLGYIQDLEIPSHSSAKQLISNDQTVKMSFEKANLNLD